MTVNSGSGRVMSEYRCPVHGVFEALVSRDTNGDPPADQPCPHAVKPRSFAIFGLEGEERARAFMCLRVSPWTISAPSVRSGASTARSSARSRVKELLK